MVLADYGMVKIDCEFVADNDDISAMEDDFELSILKRAGSASATIRAIQDLPLKEIMEISVSKLDPSLKQEFQKVYESLNSEDRDTVEHMLGFLTLKSLHNCQSLRKPFAPGEKQLSGLSYGLMKAAYRMIFWGSDQKTKDVINRVEKQIEINGPALCREMGK